MLENDEDENEVNENTKKLLNMIKNNLFINIFIIIINFYFKYFRRAINFSFKNTDKITIYYFNYFMIIYLIFKIE